ncbi:unnamed protein product [Cladocopium goreaui]|uniref:Hypersensitive-induced response protein 1 n=1 Tax=Cladocopium goreaui TaxID=2562237 RepID=A0A9P1BMD0_9DINO|nr:unnamed protein product [Cladocopium goreaui]
MSCCSCVPTGSLGVIQRFGEYQGLQEPGFRCICFPITTVRAVSLAVQQYECDTDCKTKDSVTVTVRTAVQYQIQKDTVKAAYFDIEEPMDQVRAEVGSVLRSTLPSMTLDESYEAKETMVEEILTTVRDAMKGYGYDIIKVLITDIKPEQSVMAAMNNINAQRRRREAAIEKGEAEKFLKIKAAEAEAEAKRLAGVGMAAMRAAMAHGILDSMQFITASGMSESEAMQIMVTTQYLDTLKDFSNHKSMLVPHHRDANSANDSAMLREAASLSEAPPQMLAMEEVEDVEAVEGPGKKKGKRKKKKRVVKTGTALCDCDGDNIDNQYDQAHQAHQADQAEADQVDQADQV